MDLTTARRLLLDTFENRFSEPLRKHFLAIAKKRLRGIVSQARHGPKRPYWIRPKLWKMMNRFWKTPEAQEKRATASQCRNSDRGGLSIAKHVSGQKIVLESATKNAQQVHEAYGKQLNEAMSEEDLQGPGISRNSSQRSTQRTLTIKEKNEIFRKCTQTDPKGIIFGIGELPLMVDSGKGKESFASSTVPKISQIQDQLQEAQQYMDKQDEKENSPTEAQGTTGDKEPGSTPLDAPATA
ncbi:unnamed protein product [Arabis nemorensis]|uniref:Uncharacterized protein n=1 Tax=Arabis nemorensis TaxID=586526 RepID=A0A565B9X7_9BRAS|nr:unnamed protein product [Arabis nemorensis]